jgi:lipopolysaccharide transport system ATP-binding protein
VKAIGDRALWLERGRLMEIGETDRVVAKYLARMVEKDASYLQSLPETQRAAAEPMHAPEVVESIPNIDHRYGDGRADVLGIAVLDESGRALAMLEPQTRIVVRISVRAKARVTRPMVGFMLRNHMGMDFAGTNTAREGYELPSMEPGDVVTVDFHVDLPELYPASFSFSPAIADGTLLRYAMCDWIDNALALQMGRGEGEIYGYLHLPCRIEINARLRPETPRPGAPLAEERVG